MLSSADRTRIEKLANMLSSPFDGERSNAGALLAKMAAERRMTVAELLGLAAQTQKAPETQQQPAAPEWGVDLLDDLARAVNFQSVLSSWELTFAADVSGRCFE